jgi:Mrp family chromosome partitioning ATPase
MSVLSGERMRRVIAEAGTRFDFVVIDTPPVALLTDAHLLSSLVDTVLLVVQSGRTPLAAIKTAVQAVGRERILGVVLNRADEALPSRLYGYYSGYRSANYAAR